MLTKQRWAASLLRALKIDIEALVFNDEEGGDGSEVRSKMDSAKQRMEGG